MSEKIKILRIITRLNIGGPAIHAILLNEGLNDATFNSRLAAGSCDEKEGDMGYLAKEKGLEVAIIPQLKRNITFKDDLIAFLRMFRLIKKEKPHIVHTHMAKAGTLGRIAAILAGTPIKVHTFHGHVFHSYFNSRDTRIFLLIERVIAKFTDRIIAISDLVKDEICNDFKVVDEKKASVIKLGLDLSKFQDIDKKRGSLKKELNIDKKTLLVGIIGRLTAVKNHKLFLDTIKLLKDEVPELNARFLIIGDGELRDFLEGYAHSLGIKDWVYFSGWRSDLSTVYADLDIVTLTSLNEGTPLCLIEAMASQKAVIATEVGGVSDLVENKTRGLLVSSNNKKGLKEAILTLLKDERLREEMARNGKDYVCTKYSKDRLVNDIGNLYKELLEKKGIKGGKA